MLILLFFCQNSGTQKLENLDSDGTSTIATDVTDVPTVSRTSCNSCPQGLNKRLREQMVMLDVSGDVY